MSLRLFCTIFLVISVCAFPFFFTFAIGVFAIVWFRGYYEIIPIAFLGDVMYGIPMNRFFSFPYAMTLVGAVLVVASIIVRKQLLSDRHSHI